MKILITGGAGYIGSHTAHMLINNGHCVNAYDNLEKGHEESLKGKALLTEGNLADTDKLEATIKDFKPDAVMHFAGYTEVGESMKYPQKYYKNNLLNGITLVKAMLKYGVNRLIFSSTAAVYGEPAFTPIPECAPKYPTNNYGLSKLLFERYLDSCDGLNNVCLRYFNAAGAGYGIGEDHNPETHLIPLVLKAALQQSSIKIYGTNYNTKDGTCIRDYIHVLDLAEAHILALDVVNQGASAKYNIGTGKGSSVLDIIRTAEKATGREIKKEFCERREGDPAILVADPSKIKRELGWKAKRGLKEIIISAWKWHSANPTGF